MKVSAIKLQKREHQRAFLQGILDAHPGLTLTDVAKKAGLVPSTLTRFFNDPDNTTVLNGTTMARIEAEFMPEPATGFAEPDAVPIPAGAPSAEPLANPNQSLWRVGKHFAALPGFLPGDWFILEAGLEPRDGDDVLAQIEDMAGGATTVLRKFRHGWLLGDPSTEMEWVDRRRVRIAGVIIKAWRERDG